MRRLRRVRQLVALCVLCPFVVVSCRSNPPASPAADLSDRVLLQLEDIPDGLQLRLSSGRPEIATGEPVKAAAAQKLGDAEVQQVLGRIPPLTGEPADRVDVALREGSTPPPKTGTTIKQRFPPPPSSAAPPAGAGGALEVLRFMPEGEVPLAPNLSVTFSQPMVAVTSHEGTAKDVPVVLSPTPAGRWRWVGTRTLLFDPEVRFPAATEYSVEIPAGVRAPGGGVLARATRFTFATPAPRLIASWPSTDEPSRRDALMFARFDQDIEPGAVLGTIAVVAGGERRAVRLATAEEVAKDAVIAGRVAAADGEEQKGRYLVFRAVDPLPVDREVEVAIGPGTPSREGPRRTTARQSFRFRTYGPLRVVESRCAWGDRCPPGTPWMVRFTNPLDEEAIEDLAVAITPALPGLELSASNDWLTIGGRSKGRTRYEIRLPAALKDRFGQTLGKDEVVTMKVGDAEPRLFGPTGLTVRDPSARRPTYDLHSINVPRLDVQIYKVGPADWPAFLKYQRERNPRRPSVPPGVRVVNTSINVAGAPDVMAESHIDLSAALGAGGKGHAIIHVEPSQWRDEWKPELDAWVQSTDLALDAFVDAGELTAWATRLVDGAPVAGVALELRPGRGARATSDARGLATLPLDERPVGQPILIGRLGDDVAFLPQNVHGWGDEGGFRRSTVGEQLSWLVYDDRAIYRPGEEVKLKGWLRVLDLREGGDLAGLGGRVPRVSYVVRDAQGVELGKGIADVDRAGGFDASFKLPKTPNLGHASVELTAAGRALRGSMHHHGFRIEEFRRPEYEVSASASQGPHTVGGRAEVTVAAKYFAGGPLANADTAWSVTSSATSYTPPGRDGYRFGVWVPWWLGHRGGRGGRGFPIDGGGESRTDTFAGRTDAGGRHVLRMDFVSVKPPRPMSVVAEARVTDVNRQAWAAQSTLLVHPSTLYVGLKQARTFVERGAPIEIAALVVDQEGAIKPGVAVAIRAARLKSVFKRGEYKEEEVAVQRCQVTSGERDVTCSFTPPEGGAYRITATVADERGRPNETQIMTWVSGGDAPPPRGVQQEEATLVPDKPTYAAGDTAKILVQAPFFPAEGLLTVRRSGIVRTEAFRLTSSTATLAVPIEDRDVPNLVVHVDLVGAQVRTDDDGVPQPDLPRRPAYARGELSLAVPPVSRTLAVTVRPDVGKIEPGGKTRLSVGVRDAGGRPVAGARMSVIVVDESVLALTGYRTPDPIAAFYQARDGGALDYYIRQYLMLSRPDLGSLATAQDAMANGAAGGMAESAPPPMAAPAPGRREMAKRAMVMADEDAEEGGAAAPAIALRSNFDALALFAPSVETDARGAARVAIAVPDNLTRYRIMVVAAAGENRFGVGESSITARLPLMVRPSAPRFLNFGDRFSLPVVVQNQTDRPMTVDLAVRALNLALPDGQGRRVSVPANDRVEVLLPAAAELAGTARLQVGATSGRFADASELALPVWTPATREAFATYGEIDRGATAQPVALPGAVVEQYGGLEIQTSSTQLQALTDAFVHLVQYPFECTEQTSSRILAIAGLRDVLGAFQGDGLPPPAELAKIVARDVERLGALQNRDGGFAWWIRGHESWPYLSIHAAHALTRAQEKGYAVPAEVMKRSAGYLAAIERHIPGWYPVAVRRALIAYALYVRKRMGSPDPARARALLAEAGPDQLSMDALGWLLVALSGDAGSASQRAAIHRHLGNRVSETAGAATFTSSYADGDYLILHSDRRDDAILLEALTLDRPSSDLIPKVVRGLLGHRKAGKWANTQEDAWVLLALDRYFHTFEKVTPSFVSRVWFAGRYAGEHAFRGRTTETHQIEVPMREVARAGAGDVVIEKQGKGRLYYRIGMRYAPSSLSLAPADHGFVVTRRYEAVERPDDVTRLADGTWRIRAGAPVRVRLTMVAEARRTHVALVDPLPAGLEAMNPTLAVTGTIPQDPSAQKHGGAYWWWYRPWFEHQNLRDERVEAFTTLLWAGVHEYTYVARATTPGRYVVPPTRAEEMYAPETFGRSATDRVVVE